MVKIKGREYATVAERLQAAHGDSARPQGITSIATEPLAVGSRVLIRATVTFTNGCTFSGLAEIVETDSGAQQTNPVECAETSAVGRALAMAGYFGSGDGIAGAEELAAAERRGASPRSTATRPAALVCQQCGAAVHPAAATRAADGSVRCPRHRANGAA